jgi:hypothetical protein
MFFIHGEHIASELDVENLFAVNLMLIPDL